MSNSIAERYLKLFEEDQQIRRALLACSAALQLDDETACKAVDLVAQTNGSSYMLVRRVKKLGCVWKEWNEYWHITEDVRRGLFGWLYRDLSELKIIELRELFAQAAASRAAKITSNDQAAAHERMVAKLEAAYQRLLIPKQTEEGAKQLAELWRQLPSAERETLALSVDYLAVELEQRLGRLPDEIIVLRRYAAEKALLDSLEVMETGPERGRAYYALGNLLAEDPDRRDEADQAYIKASDLVEDPEEKSQVAIARAGLEPHIQVPDTWVDDETVTIDDLRATIHNQAYQFAVSYYRLRRTEPARNPRTLTDEMYEKFFAPHQTAWQNPAEFYTYVAQLIRRILVKSARHQYSTTQNLTEFDSGLFRRWLKAPGMKVKDLLALDKAIALLQDFDPEQARIVELWSYAGLTLEKIADVMQLPTWIVEREWRMAKAFLNNEIASGNIEPGERMPVSQMMSTATFVRSCLNTESTRLRYGLT